MIYLLPTNPWAYIAHIWTLHCDSPDQIPVETAGDRVRIGTKEACATRLLDASQGAAQVAQPVADEHHAGAAAPRTTARCHRTHKELGEIDVRKKTPAPREALPSVGRYLEPEIDFSGIVFVWWQFWRNATQ